ncbi:MAG: hypothetical protein F6K14_11275 [Symploca sp. SIO2C1]|nr:hypothetical protein [Symploca sp. SIO2C1]
MTNQSAKPAPVMSVGRVLSNYRLIATFWANPPLHFWCFVLACAIAFSCRVGKLNIFDN